MVRGRQVVIDGIDGSGKTTLCYELFLALQRLGIPGASFAFPSRRNSVGGFIRKIFEGAEYVKQETLFWLFLAEGVEVASEISRHLDEGTNVIADRHCCTSSRVYQIDFYNSLAINTAIAISSIPIPDRVYILDVPVEVALDRLSKRKKPSDPFDVSPRAVFEERRQRYLRLGAGAPSKSDDTPVSNTRILDGTQSIENNVKGILVDLGWQ